MYQNNHIYGHCKLTDASVQSAQNLKNQGRIPNNKAACDAAAGFTWVEERAYEPTESEKVVCKNH